MEKKKIKIKMRIIKEAKDAKVRERGIRGGREVETALRCAASRTNYALRN